MDKSDRTTVRVVTSPTVLEGGIVGRVVELADGSGRVETWRDGSWRAGGARLNEFLTGTEPSAARLKELGINSR